MNKINLRPSKILTIDSDDDLSDWDYLINHYILQYNYKYK